MSKLFGRLPKMEWMGNFQELFYLEDQRLCLFLVGQQVAKVPNVTISKRNSVIATFLQVTFSVMR